MYGAVIKPLLFALQPETAHDVMRSVCRVANIPALSRTLQGFFGVNDPRLAVTVAGISFPNPVGLAAGFDKDVELVGLWSGLGFGHMELGTVTALPQPGNPRPRIFRLEADEALINRMGFPSSGADLVADRLRVVRERYAVLPRIGINIGKSKAADLERAIADYEDSFLKVSPHVDYVTVNVSSPNTPGLRQLQERTKLTELLKALQALNSSQKPLFVKVAPDLSFEAVSEVVECCKECEVSGIIATNTTIERDGLKSKIQEVGGLSGRPLFSRALEVVQFIKQRTDGSLALIGVGGISTYEDVLTMMWAGADMVQIYTGLIYGGPGVVKSMNLGLLAFMESSGCSSVQDAAGEWGERRRVSRTSNESV